MDKFVFVVISVETSGVLGPKTVILLNQLGTAAKVGSGEKKILIKSNHDNLEKAFIKI